MTGLAEAEGIDVFSGFAATELMMDGPRVVGVRTGDRGVGRQGEKRGTFEPGVDIRAKVTILADGVRGNLTKQLMRRSQITVGRQPQVYALGIKELWEVPAGRLPAGTVVHTLGYPLDQREFGGGFIYAMSDTRLSVGFVTGLDYEDPMFDPHIGVSAVQVASVRQRAASRGTDGALRREGAAGGRMACAARMRRGRGADRRRCRRIPQFHAPEGHSPCDEDGHAGGRNGVRRRYGGRHLQSETRQLRRENPPELGGRRNAVGAARSPGFQIRLVRGSRVCRRAAAHQRVVDSSGDSELFRATCGCEGAIRPDTGISAKT